MRIYDDHIELWNDGELPLGYTQETLLQKHSSKPRNKNIAFVFFKAGFVEAWGRGYKKICETLENVGLPMPMVKNDCGGTLVTIKRPQGNPCSQTFENVGKEEKNVGKEIPIELSERQMNIVALISLFPTITIPELSGKLSGKTSVTTRTIERDIAFLQNHGILIRKGGRKEGHWELVKNN